MRAEHVDTLFTHGACVSRVFLRVLMHRPIQRAGRGLFRECTCWLHASKCAGYVHVSPVSARKPIERVSRVRVRARGVCARVAYVSRVLARKVSNVWVTCKYAHASHACLAVRIMWSTWSRGVRITFRWRCKGRRVQNEHSKHVGVPQAVNPGKQGT